MRNQGSKKNANQGSNQNSTKIGNQSGSQSSTKNKHLDKTADFMIPIYDTPFKYLFADKRNMELTESLVKGFLEIDNKEKILLDVLNPSLPVNSDTDKQGVVDLLLITKSERVHIEVQILKLEYFTERALFYITKLYSSYLSAGESYGKLERTVSILILDHNHIQDEHYEHLFEL